MYARVNHVLVKPGKRDALIEGLKSYLSNCYGQPGFQGFLNYDRPATGTMSIITLWASQAERDASGPDSPFFQKIVGQLAPLLQGPPDVEHYEARLLAEIKEGASSVGVITVFATQDNLAEVLEIFEGSLLDDEQQHAGFMGCLELTDRNQGRVMAVTFWDSETNLLDEEISSGYQQQFNKLAELVPGTIFQEEDEVDILALDIKRPAAAASVD